MADTFTTSLSLTKPEVGASADTWGTKLNANFDAIDGLFDSGPYLAVDAGGTGSGTAAGARTSLGLGTMATQNASAVAITGGTAILSSVTSSGTQPVYYLYESDAGSEEKYWRFVSDGGVLYVGTLTDAGAAGNSAIAIDRNGTTVTSIALAATTLTFNGNAVHHAGSFTAPSSGSFTISLRSASESGTVLGTGTAYWRKFNNVVTLRIPGIFPSSTATVFYLTGLPADIQVGTLGIGQQYIPITVVNDSSAYPGVALVGDNLSYINIFSTVSAWTSDASAKGVAHTCITYQIAN